uniref:Uncharacterized protein n=1 Tax=Arundo donax TaxID=35708 RepID=A0A0A9DW24_ARUDO
MPQVQSLNRANGPLVFIGRPSKLNLNCSVLQFMYDILYPNAKLH